MRLLLLFTLLTAWHTGPAHTETGEVKIPSRGVVTVKFKTAFSVMPQCHSVAKHTHSREWIELHGKPGQQVAWSCVE